MPGPNRAHRGRDRLGGGRRAALGVSLAIGSALSAVLGTLFVTLSAPVSDPLALAEVAGLITLPVTASVGWLYLTGRAGSAAPTPDAARSASDGRRRWLSYQVAAAGAFTDLLVALGVGVVVTVLVPSAPPLPALLSALAVVAAADLLARLWWQRTHQD